MKFSWEVEVIIKIETYTLSIQFIPFQLFFWLTDISKDFFRGQVILCFFTYGKYIIVDPKCKIIRVRNCNVGLLYCSQFCYCFYSYFNNKMSKASNLVMALYLCHSKSYCSNIFATLLHSYIIHTTNLPEKTKV